MKNILFRLWNARRPRRIAVFGTAELRQTGRRRFELRGGSPSDRAEALEWTALFCHEAVPSVKEG